MWETADALFHWRKCYYRLWTHILDRSNGLMLKTSWWISFSFCLLQMLTDGLEWCGLLWCFYQTLILTAPIHCRASIGSHSDGTHSLQSIHWLSFWWHPFTAEHPLALILTAPIHCRASIGSHSDGTHSLQSIHWLSFWRHPFTAEHPLTLILTAPIHCRASIDSHSDGTHSLQSIHWLSFWRHPFTAEHPLLRHWRRDKFLQIWWRNKLLYILDGLRLSTFSAHCNFWVNYPFNDFMILLVLLG